MSIIQTEAAQHSILQGDAAQTVVAAALTGRRSIGIELEASYCAHARARLRGANRYQVHRCAA